MLYEVITRKYQSHKDHEDYDDKQKQVHGDSKDTDNFLKMCIDELTLIFLKLIGKSIRRILISDAGLMEILIV